MPVAGEAHARGLDLEEFVRFICSLFFLFALSCAVAQQPEAKPEPTPAQQAGQDASNGQKPSPAPESQPSPTPEPSNSAPQQQSAPASSSSPAPQNSTASQSTNPQNAPAAPGSTPATAIPQVLTTPAGTPALEQGVPQSKKQPKRILGVMPNYRAVSAGEIPPPPTPMQAFKVATQNSFDYSSFIFVGVTSAIAEGTDAHPQLGKGIQGFGKYYWRGFLDKTDGNYLVIFALPSIFHEDERYYAKGQGNFLKRAAYSSSRVLITPNYQGHNTFNFSEVLGRGIAQGISREYYPSKDRTLGALAVKYGYAIGRDALTNTFREFWPDIATHVLHRHP
jgi:hypothetical protein